MSNSNSFTAEIDYNELFNNSFSYIQCNEDAFFTQFYHNFMKLSPTIREVFKNTDIEKQIAMLMEAINTMVCFSATKKTSLYLAKIAHSHANTHNVKSDMYNLFMEALLMTLEQKYPKYNKHCGLAWRITLAPGIEYMRHGIYE